MAVKQGLARIIHDAFCCNREFAAAPSLAAPSPARRAGSPLSRSTYCREYASLLRGSARPARNATSGYPLLFPLQWVKRNEGS